MPYAIKPGKASQASRKEINIGDTWRVTGTAGGEDFGRTEDRRGNDGEDP